MYKSFTFKGESFASMSWFGEHDCFLYKLKNGHTNFSRSNLMQNLKCWDETGKY